MGRAIAGLMTVFVLALASSGQARAELRLCNQSEDIVYAAIGHIASDGPTVTGWFELDDQECGTFMEGVAGPYYVYGEDDFFLLYWAADEEEPGFTFCLSDDQTFTLRNADHIKGGTLDCPDEDYERFAEVIEREGGVPKYTFTLDNAKDW